MILYCFYYIIDHLNTHVHLKVRHHNKNNQPHLLLPFKSATPFVVCGRLNKKLIQGIYFIARETVFSVCFSIPGIVTVLFSCDFSMCICILLLKSNTLPISWMCYNWRTTLFGSVFDGAMCNQRGHSVRRNVCIRCRYETSIDLFNILTSKSF